MLCSLAPKNSDLSNVKHENELELNTLKCFPGGSRFPKCVEGCWFQPSDALFEFLRVKCYLIPLEHNSLSVGFVESINLQGLRSNTLVFKHCFPVESQSMIFS